MPRLFIIFFIIFILIGKNEDSFSQDSIPFGNKYNNSVSLEFLGENLVYSLNYSYVFNRKHNINGNFGFSYFFNFNSVSCSFSKLSGKRSSHFEYGIGALFLYDKDYKQDYIPNFPKGNLSGLLLIGYKYFNPKKRFVFNITFTPVLYPYFFQSGIQPWGGIGFGYRFNTPDISFFSGYYQTESRHRYSLNFSSGFGYSKWKYGNAMDNSGFVQSNMLRFKYQPERLGLNLQISNTYTAFHYLKYRRYNYDYELFTQNPMFYNFGIGLNYLVINKQDNSLSINTSTGIFLLDEKKLSGNIEMNGYYPSLLLKDIHEYRSVKRKAFNSLECVFEKKLNQEFSLLLGYNFTVKRFIPVYDAYYFYYTGSVLIYEHFLLFGLSYKL